ncbi:MAG: hypothetical protein CMD73_03335 [Gammaproteobacteria bacterium]|jgi:FKBP-type peptidyl-prolyl cis-trans isomerase 2|nr:hypothetical protein [Gammaproteobacteria bacterium]|tara:strand:+ start:318 stop:755 length:438 start_codon:yes stop_codon:yes gene_type:complete
MIKYNSKVKLHYSISTIDNIVFESTFDKQPVNITIGSGIIPQKLELTLYGLLTDSEQTITLKPCDAFGDRDNKKTQNVDISVFPNRKMIKKGNVIEIDMKEKNGKVTSTFAMIKDIKKDKVLLDLNHPLAGIEIKFKVKIIKIYD